MTLDQIKDKIASLVFLDPDIYNQWINEVDKVLKMVEEYAEEAYSDGFEQGWEENDLH